MGEGHSPLSPPLQAEGPRQGPPPPATHLEVAELVAHKCGRRIKGGTTRSRNARYESNRQGGGNKRPHRAAHHGRVKAQAGQGTWGHANQSCSKEQTGRGKKGLEGTGRTQGEGIHHRAQARCLHPPSQWGTQGQGREWGHRTLQWVKEVW